MNKSWVAAWVAVALGVCLINATVAKADDNLAVDGQYQFNYYRYTSLNTGTYDAVGSFDLNGFVISDFAGSVSVSGSISAIDSQGSFGTFSGPSANFFIQSSQSFNIFDGALQHVGSTYQSHMNGEDLVIALAGGQPGGSSPSSGGAPSPEVNTLLGFLVAVGTVAFIKRRRNNVIDAEAVAA